MNPVWVDTSITFGSLLILLATGMPIAIALAVTGFIILVFLGGDIAIVPVAIFNFLNSFTLMAVPMYIFAGEIILRSGLSSRLYRGVSQWTSVIPGGLTQTNIVSCAIFAAVSGSSTATAATIGTVAIPEQESRGYERKCVLGSLAAGGTLGILIPPSVALIVYGACVDVSVAKLFLAGVVPGIILSVMFMIWIMLWAFMRPQLFPRIEKLSWNYVTGVIAAFGDVWPVLLTIAIIMGGIYLGLTTPTEAAAVSSFVVLIMAAAFRRLNWQLVKEAGISTLRTTAMIFFIVAGAAILSYSMGMIKLPARLGDFVLSLDVGRITIWILVCIIYLILGCVMDVISMLLITIPVTWPVVVEGLGFDPIWFGVTLVILMECGLITPPVGINLFVIDGIAGGKSLGDVIVGSIPFFIIMLIMVVLLTVFPQLATWLPSTMW